MKRIRTLETREIKLDVKNGVCALDTWICLDERDEAECEGEYATPDWRVRAGPRNRPTEKEREDHEATHVPFRDWCTHCMMGRGRTHHHVTTPKSQDQSRRPTIVMDFHFIRMKLVVIAQTMPVKSLTCIAVKEDRQQPHHEQCRIEERR